MIFKVYYQETDEVPVRELTKVLYVKGKNEREIRKKLEDSTPYNIEHIQHIDGAYLEYEQQNEDFKIVEL